MQAPMHSEACWSNTAAKKNMHRLVSANPNRGDCVSDVECRNFSKLLAYHTAPTLLGIKCASLISLSLSEYNVDEHSRRFNSKTFGSGLTSRALCSCGNRVLMLIYNTALLDNRLSDKKSAAC